MPTRREAVGALGVAASLAGCLSIPELDTSLGEGDPDEPFSHPSIEIVGYEFEFQGTIDTIDIIVDIANTGSEQETVSVQLKLFDGEETLNSGSFSTSVSPGRETTDRIGNNGLILEADTTERLTHLIVSARVGVYGSPFRPVAAYSGDEIRELAGV